MTETAARALFFGIFLSGIAMIFLGGMI